MVFICTRTDAPYMSQGWRLMLLAEHAVWQSVKLLFMGYESNCIWWLPAALQISCQPGICNTSGSNGAIVFIRHSSGPSMCVVAVQTIYCCVLSIQTVYPAIQIMMMLTRDQARPDIPDISTLPGPHWSGTEGFVDLIKVTFMGTFVTSHNRQDHAYRRLAPKWLPCTLRKFSTPLIYDCLATSGALSELLCTYKLYGKPVTWRS